MNQPLPPIFDIIFLDNHLIVVNKPAGVLIQGDKTGDSTLFESVTRYIKEQFNKPGNVYLGLIHRLDRPVSGTVVFARTSKAASRLSDQFRRKTIKKTYLALVKGKIPESGKLQDYIARNGVTSRISNENDGKAAILSFKRLQYKSDLSLVKIELDTGRHHQIRVQLANLGFPILGDFRYGSKITFPNKSIALHAYSLRLVHPVKKESMVFNCQPTVQWPLFSIPGEE